MHRRTLAIKNNINRIHLGIAPAMIRCLPLSGRREGQHMECLLVLSSLVALRKNTTRADQGGTRLHDSAAPADAPTDGPARVLMDVFGFDGFRPGQEYLGVRSGDKYQLLI